MAKKQDQAALLRKARTALGVTTEELAVRLGKSRHTVRSWIQPQGKGRRTMPASSQLLLDRILAEHRATKRKAKP